MAKLVAAGVTLRDQINKAWPKRDKSSDGWIGDADHQTRTSDHNPDSRGWVHAIDIDENMGSGEDRNGATAMELANQLIKYAREGKDDGRLKYIVYEDRIASGTYSNSYWTWRGSGYDHKHHIHISFTDKAEKDGSLFRLPIFGFNDLWDGKIPEYNNVVKAMNDPELKNLAAYRLACRLHDFGFFKGEPVKYEQGYPWKAVAAWQESKGYNVQPPGTYGRKAHQKIFGE